MRKNISEFTKEITPQLQVTDEPAQAIAEFSALSNSSGWKRVIKILDIKIAQYEQEILDSDLSGNKLNRTRDRRDLCLWFRNIPDILIETLKSPPEVEKIDFDPYESKQLTEGDF